MVVLDTEVAQSLSRRLTAAGIPTVQTVKFIHDGIELCRIQTVSLVQKLTLVEFRFLKVGKSRFIHGTIALPVTNL